MKDILSKLFDNRKGYRDKIEPKLLNIYFIINKKNINYLFFIWSEIF